MLISSRNTAAYRQAERLRIARSTRQQGAD